MKLLFENWRRFVESAEYDDKFTKLLNAEKFEQAFALADSLGISRKDLPWTFNSVLKWLRTDPDYERAETASPDDEMPFVRAQLLNKIGMDTNDFRELPWSQATRGKSKRSYPVKKTKWKARGLSRRFVESVEPRGVALVPGKFKPPHAGHLEMVKHYARFVDEVVVLISPLALKIGEGKVIDADRSAQVWDIYLRDAGISNVTVMTSPSNSPVRAAFEYVENKEENPFYAQSGDRIIMGASTKDGDQQRFKGNLQKYAADGVKIVDPMKYAAEPQEPILSATDFRLALSQEEDITPWLPKTSQNEESIRQITHILNANAEEEVDDESSS